MNPEDLAPTVDLIDLLEKETGLTPAELQKLRDQAVSSGSTFDRILLNRGVAEEDMLQAFATDFDLPFLPKLEGIQVPSIFADAIPLSFARAHTMIAIGKEDDGTLTVATTPRQQ